MMPAPAGCLVVIAFFGSITGDSVRGVLQFSKFTVVKTIQYVTVPSKTPRKVITFFSNLRRLSLNSGVFIIKSCCCFFRLKKIRPFKLSFCAGGPHTVASSHEAPRGAQEHPEAPRSAQSRPEAHHRRPEGHQRRPEAHQKRPEAPQDAPEAPRGALKPPRNVQKGAQRHQIRPIGPQRSGHNIPGHAQEGKKRPQATPKRPKRPQERSQRRKIKNRRCDDDAQSRELTDVPYGIIGFISDNAIL